MVRRFIPNRIIRAALGLSALVAAATPAAAYWEYGHQTVARIAFASVRPATRAKLDALLRHGDLLGTPECAFNDMASASTWADCIKPLKDGAGKSRFGYAYNWHFQDVDVFQEFDLAAPCADGNCLNAQILRQQARLANRALPLADRVQALAFLTHFVGDLSQPLHAGEHHDQGGNKVRASYGLIAGRANLHSIWDGYLAERAISTPPGGPLGLLHATPRAERRAMVAGDVTDWSRDSWQAVTRCRLRLNPWRPVRSDQGRTPGDGRGDGPAADPGGATASRGGRAAAGKDARRRARGEAGH